MRGCLRKCILGIAAVRSQIHLVGESPFSRLFIYFLSRIAVSTYFKRAGIGTLLMLAFVVCGQCQGAKSSLLPSRPLLVQYPPPEIEIPYTEEQLQARIRRNRDDFTAHFYLMCLYAQKGLWEKSLQHSLKARQLNQLDGNVHLGTVYAYANLGRWREAYEAVQMALKLSFDSIMYSSLLRVKGDLLMDRYKQTNQKRFLDQAYSVYQEALKRDPENIQAAVGIARVKIENKDYLAAKQQLRQSLSRVKESAPGGRRRKALILYYLGVVAECEGRLKDAGQFYRDAVRIHPPSFLPLTEAELKAYLEAGLSALRRMEERNNDSLMAVFRENKKHLGMLSSRNPSR